MHVAWRKQLDAVQCMHLQYTPSILRSLSQILCLRLGTWAGVRINRHECVSVWKDGKCECCIRCTRCTYTHTHHQRSSAACQCLVLSYHVHAPHLFLRERKKGALFVGHTAWMYTYTLCASRISPALNTNRTLRINIQYSINVKPTLIDAATWLTSIQNFFK